METLFIPYYLCIHDDKKHFFMKRNGSKIFELFCELEKFMDISVPYRCWAFCRIGMRGWFKSDMTGKLHA